MEYVSLNQVKILINTDREGIHMPKVKCSVESCEYWGEGQVCLADSIMVNNDLMGDLDDETLYAYDAEFAGEYMEGAHLAETSTQTCCETMRLKNRGKERKGLDRDLC